jgi:hypothetical protein
MPRAVEEFLDSIPEPWRSFMVFLVTAVTSIVLIFKSLEKIEQDEVGLKTRVGKVVLDYSGHKRSGITRKGIRELRQKDRVLIMQGLMPEYGVPIEYGPGIRYQIILVHRFIKVKVVSRPIQLDDLTIESTNQYRGLVFRNAAVHVRVTNVYRWAILNCDSEAAVKAHLNEVAGYLLLELGYESARLIHPHLERLQKDLQLQTAKHQQSHGYVIDEFNVGQSNPIVELSTGRAIHELGLGGAVTINLGSAIQQSS